MSIFDTPPTPASFGTGPAPDGGPRRRESTSVRSAASRIAARNSVVASVGNGEESTFDATFPTNFTKGLPHNKFGKADAQAYALFADAINRPADQAASDFDIPLGPRNAPKAARPDGYSEHPDMELAFACSLKTGEDIAVRRWESPRSGHAYDLQGPDPVTVGMVPAPRMGSQELAAEMAEVYGLALLRDVPFSDIRDNATTKGPAGVSPAEVLDGLTKLPWLSIGSANLQTGFPELTGAPDVLTTFEESRIAARFEGNLGLTPQVAFRGSTLGAKAGPYLSQFLLQGDQAGPDTGIVGFGAQHIDQRVGREEAGLDYMCDWNSWLDVQLGADLAKHQVGPNGRRFITSPRDLATYVHIDALYQAYLVATLILQSYRKEQLYSYDHGLPEGGAHATRDGFATFGDPHLLSLVTEVATRALKAVRRQKFNVHRRCRPERIAAMVTLAHGVEADRYGKAAEQAATRTLDALRTTGLLDHVNSHNSDMLANTDHPLNGRGSPGWMDGKNHLLPMAFLEGSPMHPSYGAGHATVAGACVTIVKAFFHTLHANDTAVTLREAGIQHVLQPDATGAALVAAPDSPDDLTVEGELDKLAANIAIGRNMAGVHFYSDYYDSLRMGERVATGLLLEQMQTYGEPVSMRFTSFDGDRVTVRAERSPGPGGVSPSLEIEGSSPTAWWRRHVLSGHTA